MNSSLRSRPALGALLVFLVGLALGFTTLSAYALQIAIGVLLIVAVSLWGGRYYAPLRTVVFLLAASAFGFFVAANFKEHLSTGATAYEGTCRAVTLSEANRTKHYQRVLTRFSDGKKVMLYLPLSGECPQIGDTLQLPRATIVPTDRQSQASYRHFLMSKGACGVCYPYTYRLYKAQHSTSVRRFALSVRDRLLRRVDSLIESEQSRAIIYSVCFGYRNESREVADKFRTVGAAHIMAVSGLHLGIVVYFVWFLLAPLISSARQRRWLSIVVIAVAWIFALLTGLSTPTIRAAFMLTLYEIADVWGVSRDRINVLAFSAFVLLAIHPGFLFDIGFQLSYMAILSIALFYPLFYKTSRARLRKNPLISYLYGLVALSISAQVLTIPLILYYFGSTSLWVLWSNIPLVILSGALIPLVLITVLFIPSGMLFSTLGAVIAWLCNVILEVIESFLQMGGGMLRVHITLGGMMALYLMIAALYQAILILHHRVDGYEALYGSEKRLKESIRVPRKFMKPANLDGLTSGSQPPLSIK